MVLAAIVIWPAGSGTVFAQPPVPVNATITGTVLYNGRPVMEQTDVVASIWVEYVDTCESLPTEPTYDSTTGTYTVPNVPPGEYLIYAAFDSAPPFNGMFGFGGDFTGSGKVVVTGAEGTIRRDLSVVNKIHLTSPVDNQKVIGTIGGPIDTYAQGQLTFVWEAVPGAIDYVV
ncbi:hypothetical protein ACFLV1_01845, partial [Chloroflexota bacterium]